MRYVQTFSIPVPEDIADLASRSTTSASISRAVDELNTWLRTVAEALSALPDPASAGDLATMLGVSRATVAAAVESFDSAACSGARMTSCTWCGRYAKRSNRIQVVWLPHRLARCRSTRSMRPSMPAAPKLGPSWNGLLWSPTGAVRYADRPVSIASARSPIERLLSHQLLRPLDAETVILPREVSWRLRAGRFTAEPVATEPPMLIGQLRDADLVDRAAAGAAFAVLHDIELLAHQLETVPHKLLRGGGLATRDVSALARHLALIPTHASFLIECAAAAQLVAPGSTGSLLPTPEYDHWLGRDAASRWRVVAGPGLVPTGSSPGRLRPAVTPSDRRRTPAARSACEQPCCGSPKRSSRAR